MQNWEVMNTLKPALLSLSPQSKEMQVIGFETNKQKACYLSDKQARWVQVEAIEKERKSNTESEMRFKKCDETEQLARQKENKQSIKIAC